MNKRYIDFTPKKRLPETPKRNLSEIFVSTLTAEEGRYLTIRDICRILGCGRSTAYKLIARLKQNQPGIALSESPGCISKELLFRHLYGAEGKDGSLWNN